MIVNLSSTAPRSEEEIKKIPLKKGLRVYFFFAYFMFVGAGLALLAGILNLLYIHDFGLAIFQAVFGTGFFFLMGFFLLYRPARKRLEIRRTAFLYGILTDAKVTTQKRRFVAWKSSRDWVIEAEIVAGSGQKITDILQTSKYKLAQSLKPGAKIQALYAKDQNTLFFPLEIGVQIN